MAESQIRWKKSDYLRLGKAVANFNRQVIKADKANKMAVNFLPELKKYKNVKDSITTRREFNRVINSLSRINKADALDLIYLKSGEEISNWEYQETKRQAKILERNLQKEIEEYKVKEGLMGNERIGEIKATLQNLQDFEMKKGHEYKELMKEIQKKGTTDWQFKMQVVFKENYLSALKYYENQPFYDELIKQIQNLNPTKFYEIVKENNLIDFLSADWYKLDKDKYSQLINNLGIANLENYEYLGKITTEF